MSINCKKLCILTSVHPLFDTRIFHKEAKSLVKAGFDVTLIAQHDRDEIVDRIKIISVPRPKNRFERMTKTIWKVYQKALKVDADIYHFHDPELILIGMLLKHNGKKIIYDMHENVPKSINDKSWIIPALRNLISRLVYLGEKNFLVDIPLIFAEASYCNDYSWAKKYTTVLNMPLIDQLSPSQKINTLENGKFSIAYMGVVTALRGSMITIEALKSLKVQGIEVRFECIGPIDNAHKAQLLKLCEEYNLNDIRFYGYLPAHEGWSIIAQCHIGLAVLEPIPNYVESYPTKILEYMAMAIPVIASNFSLYRNIVEKEHCGICVDPYNHEEIARAIQYIMEHPGEAERMGKNGRRVVEERFNWSLEEKKLLKFYDEITR